MKFYFCEKCGKRLTEVEIEAGRAKDKKLKGVYCRECSVGVLTMETMPMTEEQAREILGKPKQGPSNPVPMPAPQPARAAVERIRKPSVEPAKSDLSPAAKGMIAGEVLAFMLVGLWSLLGSKGNDTSGRNTEARAANPPTAVKTSGPSEFKTAERGDSKAPNISEKKTAAPTQPRQPVSGAGNYARTGEYIVTLQQGLPVKEANLVDYQGTKCGVVFGNGENANKNRKPGAVLEIGSIRQKKALIAFSVCAREGGPLSDDAEILDAQLHLYRFGQNVPVSLRRCLKPWKPEEITFNTIVAEEKFFAEHPPLVGGLKQEGRYEFDCTQALKDALKEGKNFGWVIEAANSSPNQYWVVYPVAGALYDKDPALRPKLVLKIRGISSPGDSSSDLQKSR